MKKILIYGSTFLTELSVGTLMQCKSDIDVIGYVPSKQPAFPGEIPLQQYTADQVPDLDFDMAISIQYDRKILYTDKTYNLHTGLLPEYGGCNILYHTIENGEHEQGLTFHKITNKIDCGPILSKITYPVLPTDQIVDLYYKMCTLVPSFTVVCLSLVLGHGHEWTKDRPYEESHSYPKHDHTIDQHIFGEGKRAIEAFIKAYREGNKPNAVYS